MSKMKILFYNHTGQVSGAEYLLLMILAGLDRDSFSAMVICPEQGPLLENVKGLSVPAEKVRGLDARFTLRPDFLLYYLRSFWHVIRDVRRAVVAIAPDLVHANSIRAGLVATAATVGLKTRVVWHVHDLLPRHPLSILIRACACLATRTRMIAVSQSVADNFTGAFFPLRRRVSVILNGIDLEKFQPNQTSRNAIREELRIEQADLVIGIVGQLTRRKGQLELVRAFARVVRELPRAVLVIVGSPLFNRDQEYADSIQQTATELGFDDRVRMTGPRSDVSAVMQAIDLLVVNSSVEPFGLVALEAMACGRPVLAAISGGIPELIEHRRNGWLIKQGDEDALTDAIVHLGRDPGLRGQFAAQGKRHVTSRFSADRYVAELHDFYCSMNNSILAVAEDPAGRQTEAAKFA